MKKFTALALVLLFLLALLTSCSGNAGESSIGVTYEENYDYAEKEYLNDMGSGSASYDGFAPVPEPAAAPNYSSAASADIAPVPPRDEYNLVSPGDKIVYTASAGIETLDFEKSVADLEVLINGFGGFIESSHVTGNPISIYEDSSYNTRVSTNLRTASYTVRIPKESFETAKTSLSDLGNVTSLSTSASNITGQYTDIEARLKMYTTEEERLLVMLAKADTVADMIMIEQTLSQVRYNIESLTSNLRALDMKVSYSTISIYIREVERLTIVTEPHRTYVQQMFDGLKRTIFNIGIFFAELFKLAVINLPLIVLAALAVFAVYITAKNRSKNKTNTETEDDNDKTEK